MGHLWTKWILSYHYLLNVLMVVRSYQLSPSNAYTDNLQQRPIVGGFKIIYKAGAILRAFNPYRAPYIPFVFILLPTMGLEPILIVWLELCMLERLINHNHVFSIKPAPCQAGNFLFQYVKNVIFFLYINIRKNIRGAKYIHIYLYILYRYKNISIYFSVVRSRFSILNTYQPSTHIATHIWTPITVVFSP